MRKEFLFVVALMASLMFSCEGKVVRFAPVSDDDKGKVELDEDIADIDDDGNTADSGDDSGDTSDTGNDVGNTGNDVGNTGNDVGNTGNDVGNTGNDVGNTGDDTGNTGNDVGNTGDDSDTGDTGDPIICTPYEINCNGNTLETCNSEGTFLAEKDCSTLGGATGVCEEPIKNCLYTGSLGGTSSSSGRSGRRGNFFDCEKDVTVVEFAQRFNLSNSATLIWGIYETEGSSSSYTRIFSQTQNMGSDGVGYYSSGTIDVKLKAGKKYLFFVDWSTGTTRSISFYTGGSHPVDLGFGKSTNGYNTNHGTPGETLTPSTNNYVYTQRIKFVEE
ncbi:MAG: hypothetical protein ACOX2F_01510 [bacterium]